MNSFTQHSTKSANQFICLNSGHILNLIRLTAIKQLRKLLEIMRTRMRFTFSLILLLRPLLVTDTVGCTVYVY